MAKKHCRKFQPVRVGRTNVTDDRQICDSKDPNVTLSHKLTAFDLKY